MSLMLGATLDLRGGGQYNDSGYDGTEVNLSPPIRCVGQVTQSQKNASGKLDK